MGASFDYEVVGLVEPWDKGFTVLAVNLQEDPRTVAAFMQQYKLTFPALLDLDGQVSRTYQAFSLPSSFFVDRKS